MRAEQVVYAVDDDRRFLTALERTLRTSRYDVRCYQSAGDFLDQFDPNQPGCVISDLCMPEMDGLALQQALKNRNVSLPVIFITGYGDTRKAVAALKEGAFDFIEKPFGEKTLLDSVRQALEKNAEERRQLSEQLLVEERFGSLTPREKEIFALVVSDLSNKQIARRLDISPRTVEHHREHVMLKMQAHSMAELVTSAVLCGIHKLHL